MDAYESTFCCPICFNHYTPGGDFMPLVLACGHTISANCVREMTASAAGVKCPLRCESSGNQAPSPNWTLIAVLGGGFARTAPDAAPAAFSCTHHPGQRTDVVCEHAGCNKALICRDCRDFGPHEGHKGRLASTVSKEYAEALTEARRRVAGVARQAEATARRATAALVEINGPGGARLCAEAGVREIFAGLRALVDAGETAALGKVAAEANRKTEAWDACRMRATQQLTCVQDACTQAGTVCVLDDHSLCAQAPAAIQKLFDIAAQPPLEALVETSAIPVREGATLASAISDYCVVGLPVLDPGPHTYGVNAKDIVHYRVGRDGHWRAIPGRLKQVTVSPDGRHVWGVDATDHIHYREAPAGEWRKVGGSLKFVAVSANGVHVWGVNSKDDIYYRAGLEGSWRQISGKLKQIAVSGDGAHVWGVNTLDDIYYRSGVDGEWKYIPGKLKQISVSGDGSIVIGVNKDDEIYHRTGPQGEWRILDGRLKHVDVSGDGQHLWGCNASDQIYYRNGLQAACWERIGGALKCVAVS